MLELCIDTSDGASVAVVQEGEVLSCVRNPDPRQHAESLAVLVAQANAEAGLNRTGIPVDAGDDDMTNSLGWGRVNVGTGPAPFTGLRAGLVTAQVLAHTWGVPLYGVSSLEIIGRQALDLLPPQTEVVAVTDARRKEIYWAQYRASGPDLVAVLHKPSVSRPEDLGGVLRPSESAQKTIIVGPGAYLVKEFLDVELGPTEPVDPSVLSRLVGGYLREDPTVELPVEPLYLRRPEINGSPAK